MRPLPNIEGGFGCPFCGAGSNPQAGHAGVVVGHDEGWNLVSWAIDEDNPERPVLNYRDEHLVIAP